MRTQKMSDSRIAAFSDGVIAVIITIMVLDLKAPEAPTLAALLPLWPTMLSYAVSYLFIAIVWINHHHLFHFIHRVTPRLVWVNFVHLFGVSLVPFATAWVARTELAPWPTAVYALVFVGVNAAYRVFEAEALKQALPSQVCPRMRSLMRRRSLAAMLIFAAASFASLLAPSAGFAMVCAALCLYLKPEVPDGWNLSSLLLATGRTR